MTADMKAQPEKLVLASASPRRRELLARHGLSFLVRPAEVEEDDSGLQGPEHMVAANAALKAGAVAAAEPRALVLGSDTTVSLDGDVLSKPADLDEARAMLGRLSGRRHEVYTAVSLRWLEGGLEEDFVERSAVRFKRLDADLIERYFSLVDPLDKAGAYGIQSGREMIIEAVDGSVDNVMGLPVERLIARFEELGFDFADQK